MVSDFARQAVAQQGVAHARALGLAVVMVLALSPLASLVLDVSALG